MSKNNQQLVLYSTNTRLAYRIAQVFYGDFHYVWCSPYFDDSNLPKQDINLPSSSTPREIGRTLLREISSGDRHSAKIEQNRKSLVSAAGIKLKDGVIDHSEYLEIKEIIETTELNEFLPLLFVIPYVLVIKLLAKAPVSMRANPLSQEYIIEKLPRAYFDIIPFSEGVLT
jgi:hypothetical protein